MENKYVKQHNFLTGARYEMSSLEKNLIYMMLGQLKDEDPWERQYEIPIQALQQKRGVRIRREELLSAAKKLISRGLTIYNEEKKEFITIGILVSANYSSKEQKQCLVLEFDQKLYPFLVNLKRRFTTYRLQAALDLRSKYAKRMYEMLSQFKDTGIMKISLKELKLRLGLIDEVKGKERYSEFSLFTKKVLDVAQKELAEHTELRFSYGAQKTGRKYTNLEFKISSTVSPKNVAKQQFVVQQGDTPEVPVKLQKGIYKHPDLQGDALQQYLYMTKELKWLEKSLAYKVVTTIPTKHLWSYINKLELEIKKGNPTSPKTFFTNLLVKRQNIPSVEIRQEAKPLLEEQPYKTTSAGGACYKKLVLEFGLDIFIVSRIATQIPPEELKSLLDKITIEIAEKKIPASARSNYVLTILKEVYQISL